MSDNRDYLNDYILRGAVIADLYGDYRDIEVVEHFPAADVRENVRAFKEIVEAQPYFKKHYRRLCCSNCKREVLKTWSFCPDCGAHFVKEKKDEQGNAK